MQPVVPFLYPCQNYGIGKIEQLMPLLPSVFDRTQTKEDQNWSSVGTYQELRKPYSSSTGVAVARIIEWYRRKGEKKEKGKRKREKKWKVVKTGLVWCWADEEMWELIYSTMICIDFDFTISIILLCARPIFIWEFFFFSLRCEKLSVLVFSES